MLTQERLKDLFNYDESTGLLIRLTKPSNGNNIGRIVGTKNKSGYLIVGIAGKSCKVHRLVWLYHYGEAPKEVDHINGCKEDNRLCNLRVADRFLNTQNLQRATKISTTGVLCVFMHGERYRAQFTANKKKIHVGYFNTIEEATLRVTEAKRIYQQGFTG